MKPDESEFDTCATDKPICPYCGAAIPADDPIESGLLDCDECGAVMEVAVDFHVYYTTWRKEVAK